MTHAWVFPISREIVATDIQRFEFCRQIETHRCAAPSSLETWNCGLEIDKSKQKNTMKKSTKWDLQLFLWKRLTFWRTFCVSIMPFLWLHFHKSAPRRPQTTRFLETLSLDPFGFEAKCPADESFDNRKSSRAKVCCNSFIAFSIIFSRLQVILLRKSIHFYCCSQTKVLTFVIAAFLPKSSCFSWICFDK